MTAPLNVYSPLAHYAGRPCPYCGETMAKQGDMRPSRDHVIPRSLGGQLSGWNRLVCCVGCNNTKGDLTLEEWWLLASNSGSEELAFRLEALIRARFANLAYRLHGCRQKASKNKRAAYARRCEAWVALGLIAVDVSRETSPAEVVRAIGMD